MRFKGKRVLIVGLGESGKAAAAFFGRQGAIVSATDLQPAEKMLTVKEELEKQGVECHFGGHPASLFLGQDMIVPSPGVPWNLPRLDAARNSGVQVMGELEIAAGLLRGRVIGVTGANGKTTTTALIGHILESAGKRVQIGGNIGRPVLAMVDESTPHTCDDTWDDNWNVLELSSFQLEAMNSFRSHIGVVLNITPDHLDRHGTFEAYAAAKARIMRAQKSGDHLVLNADDAVCRSFAEASRAQVVWFSRTSSGGARQGSFGAVVQDDWLLWNGGKVTETTLPIRGTHNLENALAAVAATSLAGIPASEIGRAMGSFRPVEHRLEFVRNVAGVDYYNDSKATNVDATLKALEAFDSGLWVILGGTDKGSDYRTLQDALSQRAKAALLIGASAAKIEQQLEGRVPVHVLGTLERAVQFAHRQASPGDTVLLAPACASFDQFDNYEHRGRVFKDLIASSS